jgi:uncharacterized protein (DUF58 family)
MAAAIRSGSGGSRVLDPATLAEIRDLRLIARALVEGFLTGGHSSPRPSAGFEFRQFRAYEPGDDLRQVDWKAYARSSRLVIRESQAERDLTVRFVLDATASMSMPAGHEGAGGPAGGPGLRTFDTARYLVAALAYLVDLQGDRLRLDVVRDGQLQAQPLGSGAPGARSQFLAAVHALEGLEPTGRWPVGQAAEMLFAGSLRREREMVVFVSDLQDEQDETLEAIRLPRATGREVLVFQLVSRQELEFPFVGDVVFEDLESGRRVGGNASRMRDASLRALAARRAVVRRSILEQGAVHELVVADEPLDRALRDFLRRRQRFA